MKKYIFFIAFALPIMINAQTKLSQSVIDDFSTQIGAHYQLPHDSITGYIAEQLTRSGNAGLDIDTTMFGLKQDPVALDAALKYFYQYSDCNRQRLIANLRNMSLQNSSIFPIATYTTNKYKNEIKVLQEDKINFLSTYTGPVTGKKPPASLAEVTAANNPGAVTSTSHLQSGDTTQTADSAITITDTRNWEVRPLFQVRTPKQLMEMYGANNVIKQDAINLAGNNNGDAYLIYPDTDDELEVQFDGDNGNIITFSHYPSKWQSPYGIKAGDPLDKLNKINGRPFKINGFEWTNGGLVSNWQGGALEGKNVTIVLKATNTGDPKQFDLVTGDKILRSDLPVLKKLHVIVEAVAFKNNQ